MKKIIITALTTIFALTLCYSQDVLTKKTGEDIKTKILEVGQTEIKYKKFDNQGGPTFTILKSDVLIIRYENGAKEIFNQEKFIDEGTSSSNISGVLITKSQADSAKYYKGYRGIAELGFQIGTGDKSMNRLKLNIINGYQINPYFSLGFGTGLRYYFDAKAALIPVFADFRANLINNNISPYLSLGVGYSFDATSGFEGIGFLLNPTVGVRFRVSVKSAMNLSLGYEKQNIYYISGNAGAISMNVGISF